MALSRQAQKFADEIRNHDWSDAPWRLDRAGHRRDNDSNRGPTVLTEQETDFVRTNVMWVVGQVLLDEDPNLDPFEFAEACGVKTSTASGRPQSGHITAGFRMEHARRQAARGGRP